MNPFQAFDVKAEVVRLAQLATLAEGEEKKQKIYSDEELEGVIRNGGTVLVWSRVLNDHMYWVNTELEASKDNLINSGIAVYTLAELEELVSQKHSAEHLKLVHNVKKEWKVTIHPSPKDENLPSPPANSANPANQSEIDTLLDFLIHTIELEPDSDHWNFSDNYPYWAKADLLSSYYRVYCERIGQMPLDDAGFRAVVHKVLPHAKYYEKVERFGERMDEWRGFRMSSIQ